MFSETKRKGVNQGYLNSPSKKSLEWLGSRNKEEILDEVRRIIPEDCLPEELKDLFTIKFFEENSDEKPNRCLRIPGFFGDRPEESEEKSKIYEHIRRMGLEADD